MLEESGQLHLGVEFEDKPHFDFTLRPLKVKDTFEAMKEAGQQGTLFLEMCILARQLQKLGSIPKENLTGDLLMGTLYDSDLAQIEKAREALQKKILVFRPDFGNTAS